MTIRLALVTTWGSTVRCGIRTYSEALSKTLAQEGVESYIIRIPRLGRKTDEITRNLAESIPADKVDLILSEHEYGLWQGHEASYLQALKLLKLPHLVTMHAVGMISSTDLMLGRESKRLIVHNKYCARILRREGYKRPLIIPHGCSINETMPMEEARTKYNIPLNAKIIGCVGFLSEYKGIEALIEAAAHIRDAYLLIGGGWHVTGPEPEHITRLKSFAEMVMPGRYDFTGYVPDEDLASVYGAMTLVCYPSFMVTESGGLLMALSHGKAVLARRLAPNQEKEQAGALETFRTIKELTAKIQSILGDDERRTRLEEGAKAYCRLNSWNVSAKKHRILFEECLKGE